MVLTISSFFYIELINIIVTVTMNAIHYFYVFFSKIGGPTISKSSLLARLSGNQNIGEMPMYYSDNNYMIVKFRTDSSVQMPGFTFEWNTGKIMLQLQHNASLNNLVFNCFGTLLLCAVIRPSLFQSVGEAIAKPLNQSYCDQKVAIKLLHAIII